MKKIVTFALVMSMLFAAAFSAFAQQNAGRAAVIINHYAAAPQSFTAGAIPKADLDLIVQAGVRAPSARNNQDWRFTVVQNQNLAKQIIPNIPDGNVLIVVSAPGDSKTNGAKILDAALAVENIYLAAQALGYGSRIQTGIMDTVNSKFKGDLGLPSGYSAVALVRVGKVQAKTDAVSAASARKKVEEVVIYK